MGKPGSGARNSSCACLLWFYLQFSFVYLSAQLPPKKKEVVREKDKMFQKTSFLLANLWFLLKLCLRQYLSAYFICYKHGWITELWWKTYCVNRGHERTLLKFWAWKLQLHCDKGSWGELEGRWPFPVRKQTQDHNTHTTCLGKKIQPLWFGRQNNI